MSYAQSGTNGYADGSYARGQNGRSREDLEEGGPAGASRARRAGGYGGFLGDNLPSPSEVEPPIASRHMPYDVGSNGRFANESPDRGVQGYMARDGRDISNARTYGTGPGGRQIEGVIQHIEESWDVLTKDDCVPVHVALQLMDHSSLGRGNDYQDFQRTSQQLQKALKAIVNEHHQGFNSSIGTFHKIQSSIQASQARVRALKDSVQDAKASLMIAKPELKGMGTCSQNYDDMVRIFGQIEKLQSIPEQLDARIAEKHFLLAVDLLQDALRLIRRSDMENIGALTDLRIYFSNQETSLADILVEELHDHIYLKSPYSQDRWKSSQADPTISMASESSTLAFPNSWGRPLYTFLDSLDTSVFMEEDASKNPETDSFNYIHLVLESLSRLGHLDAAVNTMEQRLPVELFAIVDRTNQEVDLRHLSHLRNLQGVDKRLAGTGRDDNNSRSDVLNDLLSTLYSKLEAIAEGHRAVHDVVVGITKREGLANRSDLSGGFKEMWKLYQSEMRSLLHDYLATDGDNSTRSSRMAITEANVFHKTYRDKSKRVFKLAEIDKKSADLTTEQEDLDQILKASVPGLVSKSRVRPGVIDLKNSTLDGPVAGHKLLIDPSVFNISLLLPPSLGFLQRLKDIVPPDSDIAKSTLTSFLDDFLVNVFHPQLEETVTELCTQAITGINAFQKDPQWSQKASKPVFKGTSTFFALIQSFCKLLQTIPQDPSFTQLLVSQITSYYDKCSEWYKALVARPRTQEQSESQLKTAAVMAQSGEIREVAEQMLNNTEAGVDALLYNEIGILVSANQEQPFQPSDIISDHRNVPALCLLHTSMVWLASSLSALRQVVSEPSATSTKSAQTRRWTMLNLQTNRSSTASTHPRLSLTPSIATSFDQTLSSIRSLALTALLTLHLDIRVGTIHMLSRTLSAPYLLAQPTQEPDPSVLTLNNDLLSSDDTLSTHLDTREHAYIIRGLALLIDTVLISLTPKLVPAMNTDGCARIQLNILVLQQNLKAIEADAVLSRSVEYFDLFTRGAGGIVSLAKEQGKDIGFTLEELKGLVTLCYSEGLRSEGREGAVAARKGMSSALMELSEVLWDT